MNLRRLAALSLAGLAGSLPSAADPLEFSMQTRVVSPGGLEIKATGVKWEPAQTALIVCDFWDSHHCANAVKRVNEMAPRLAAVVESLRARGVLIIHAPSDCMASYAGHPARQRAIDAPRASTLPEGIAKWLYWKDPVEEAAGYPIDHTDGGSDDTPEEVVAWKRQLAAEGRDKQKYPWRGEHPSIVIDGTRDAISDKGEEVWNLLEQRGITNVLFTGVHANMCVCGRPFGLRQLSRHGKNVVLLRDLTDTMYNPARRPFVSHARGTELMVAHIERYICPTSLSSEIVGGRAHVSPSDPRPSLAVMIGEDEYRTWETLPAWVESGVGKDFRVSYVVETTAKDGTFAGIDVLKRADAVIVSVRRRTPPRDQLDAVREFVSRGGGVVGIRTASHAFSLRGDGKPTDGRDAWPEWDAEVLGGNYSGHHGKESATIAKVVATGNPAARGLVEGLPESEFATGGSLYKTSPLRAGTTLLLSGRAEGIDQPEPVAWTHTSPGGGRVFYTSLGHANDFQRPEFQRLLENAVRWSVAGVRR